jgi:DNA-binding HxlR family transcriptional regulator
MSKKYNQPCNIAGTLDIVGDRWTLLIIRQLLRGDKKFNEIKQGLEGIAPNILSDRLQMLEQEGIVVSTLYSKHPPRFEYALTEKGRELRHVLIALSDWGNRYLEKRYARLVHPECGHDVEIIYRCPQCNSTTKRLRYEELKGEEEPAQNA